MNAPITEPSSQSPSMDYHALNAMLNLYDNDGRLQLHADAEATRAYFLEHVNNNTVFFHTLEEKLNYLVREGYYEGELLTFYSDAFIKSLFQRAYAYKYRFSSFLGAFKYYTSYTLKTFDGQRYLERFEDRVVMTGLMLGKGNTQLAEHIVDEVMTGRFQPATPTFMNAGKRQRGELVSCFLLRIEDNMESIGRAVNSSLQLSKRGGGVALLLSNIRETGAPIKQIEGQSSGIIPVMKMLEDAFSYANQLGARQGSGAVYLNAHHPDIMKFLDTKRENADEKIRIKTLSLGVVIPDITFELAKRGEDMYLFSPYDVERVYGKAFGDISVSEHYYEMVDDARIRKSKINARELFQTLAEVQFESGYPYVMFEDTVNRANPIDGRVNMSNLCVAPESTLLTDRGEYPIVTLAGRQVNVWNGHEYSNVTVEKTSDHQKLVTVVLSDGRKLECTEYHKWYVQDGYDDEPREVRTHELSLGDRLIKWSSPVIEGQAEMNRPYTNGFATGDGTTLSDTRTRLYLYGEKMRLHDAFEETIQWRTAKERLEADVHGLNERFFVPQANYTVKSRLDWLAGWLDADGSVFRNGDNHSISGASVNHAFLVDVQRMLLSLGVNARITEMHAARERALPTNDGSGGLRNYECQACYRIFITSYETQKLLELGLNTQRLQIPVRKVTRNAAHFTTVVAIEDHGRYDATYCVTEPKRHMAVFNGILTGNCSEILQVNSPSKLADNLDHVFTGNDISCNLGSLNIATTMDGDDFGHTVETAIRALTSVAEQSDIQSVPSIAKGNRRSRAIGLGQMNLHGYLAREHIAYGSPEGIDFTNIYFYTVAYHAVRASCQLAKENGEWFEGFEASAYADGSYFDKYTQHPWVPETARVQALFTDAGIHIPTQDDWRDLREQVMRYGLYNRNLQAVPPTGSISYINHATSSIHPVASKIEIRKEGKLGRVYYPAPYLNDDNQAYYEDAYAIGPEKIIDTYAAATQHVDQGLSLTLFFPDTATTRDINKAQIYAWKKGIKTIYYVRLRQAALEGTEIEGCVSCSL